MLTSGLELGTFQTNVTITALCIVNSHKFQTTHAGEHVSSKLADSFMLNYEQRPFAKDRKWMYNWMPDGEIEYVTCIEQCFRGSQNRMEYD